MRHCACFLALLALLTAACSSPSSAGGATADADDAKFDAQSDVATAQDAEDATAPDDTVTDTGGASDVETPDIAETDADLPDMNWDELPDPDATSDIDFTKPVGQLYAHTSDTLYRLDAVANAFTLVGKFTFDKASGSVTDIALDRYGKLFAITNHDLFACVTATAACKWLAAFPGTGTFNGLTFVPTGTISATSETLIGIGTDGSWNQIDVVGTTTTITKLGSYGGKWLSSGDAFSVEGIGTYATLKGVSKTDSLAQIDPKTGAILAIVGETGVNQLFGLAWWNGVFYGVSNDGNVYTLDTTTGAASKVSGISAPKGVKWWGAGVSTRANGGS